ncbi:hypothetical protein LCGC14_1649140 [marine sediment metagenome]|uniref:Uncharacterized protein n=1 Tax=marine sediment metagenome TaxID=412755 RepID=A0A0F9HY88_9ZZZZ
MPDPMRSFLLLVNEMTYNDRQRLREMLSAIGATLRRTSTPEVGPVEVMVEAIASDLRRIEEVFRQVGIPIVGIEEIEVEE